MRAWLLFLAPLVLVALPFLLPIVIAVTLVWLLSGRGNGLDARIVAARRARDPHAAHQAAIARRGPLDLTTQEA